MINKTKTAPLFALTFPNINPIALQIGPISIHWYGLSYIAGLLLGFEMAKKAIQKIQLKMDLNELLSAVMIGIIIGGRLGYVLIYDPLFYISYPLEIIAIWHGGMSFHGGALGAFFGTIYACKKEKASIHKGLDLLALCATPGLFFGRIANFINGELYGRSTTHTFGMLFPNGGNVLRHPSQLYEALGEGLILGIILLITTYFFYREGRVFSIFVIGYGIIRLCIEFTREPDNHLGLLFLNLSMGQWLSIIMIVLGGVWTYARIKNRLY
ncbi:MAG: prolipoprotein diacylglyceryl transferase [Candidatus Margulisiibacteriota bacterium]